MTKLILSIYVGVALACALISFILLNTLTSKALMKYYLAMYDGKVVDEKLGAMPEDVKEAFGKTLNKFGRSYVENYKNSTKDYVIMTFTSIFLAILPMLNVLLLIVGFKIYHSVIELSDRADKYYINNGVVD